MAPVRVHASSGGVIGEEAVDAVVRERVLSSGVTGAETFGERRIAPVPLYEGAFGV